MKISPIKKTVTVILICSISLYTVVVPLKASAQGLSVPTTMILDVSPSSVKRTADTTMLQVKNYVLDGLAWTFAKIMLQQITASVVNWINSGFQGNPSFLSNPAAFFMDVGDQITGNFIAETGILSGLCTPFNIDIRLALALGQGSQYRPRYTCTLSSVIQNVRNSTINGYSIEGFMGGDFRQGGWPAFITMTTQPQNNPVGAYLTAQSDLLQRIGVTQDRVKQDLIQGSGFLSWQKCKDIPLNAGVLQSEDPLDSRLSDYYESGATSNRVCETQTPGSVIGGSINKALGIPQDQLNLADSLNEIVGALMSQLVTQVLNKGLRSASSGGGGGVTRGIAMQLSEQKETQQLEMSKRSLKDSVSSYYNNASQYKQVYEQASSSIASVRDQYSAGRACFEIKLASLEQSRNNPTYYSYNLSYGRGRIAAIDTAVAAKVMPLETRNAPKLVNANARLASTGRLLADVDAASTTDSLRTVSDRFSAAVQGGSQTAGPASMFVGLTDIQTAQNDLRDLQETLAPLIEEAAGFQSNCASFPHALANTFDD